jgi:DNA-binding LacI/PurR family transcriptional regulator
MRTAKDPVTRPQAADSKVTLRTLAKELGVSVMTMSFALRGSREVSSEMRAKALAIAKRRGYRPDPQLAKLMSYLRHGQLSRPVTNLAAVVESWEIAAASGPHYRDRMLVGVRERAQSLGYAIDLIEMNRFKGPEQLKRVLVSRGVEGIVLLPMRTIGDFAERLDWSKFSVVAATTAVTSPRFHRVSPNHFDNMRNACVALKNLGYRRIGLAMSRYWDQRVTYRWKGGIAWQNQFGETEPVPAFLSDGEGPELDTRGLLQWIAAERPDAIILESYDNQELRAALNSIPKGMRPAIVTMNWPNSHADGGIDQNPHRIGEVAVELLAGMVVRGEKGIPTLPNQATVDGAWVLGSIKPRQGSGKPRRRK